jgi:hypothetical protein
MRKLAWSRLFAAYHLRIHGPSEPVWRQLSVRGGRRGAGGSQLSGIARAGPLASAAIARRGNRRLNHVIHMAAITQIRYRHSRAYYDRKLAEGRRTKRHSGPSSDESAMPSAAASRPTHGALLPGRLQRAREGNRGTTLSPARPACTPGTGSSAKPLPDPNPPYDPLPRASGPSHRNELQGTPGRPLDTKRLRYGRQRSRQRGRLRSARTGDYGRVSGGSLKCARRSCRHRR